MEWVFRWYIEDNIETDEQWNSFELILSDNFNDTSIIDRIKSAVQEKIETLQSVLYFKNTEE